MTELPSTPTSSGEISTIIENKDPQSDSPKVYKRRNTTITQEIACPNSNSSSIVSRTGNQLFPFGLKKSSSSSLQFKENSIELNNLQSSLFEKRSNLNVVKGNLAEVKQNLDDQQSYYVELREERTKKQKEMNSTSNGLLKVKEELSVQKKYFDDKHALELQQLRVQYNAKTNQLKTQYGDKLEKLKYYKIKKLEEERDELSNQIEEVKLKISEMFQLYETAIRDYTTEQNAIKEEWLSDYNSKFEQNESSNENLKEDINIVTNNVENILKPKCEEQLSKIDELNVTLKDLQSALKNKRVNNTISENDISKKRDEIAQLKKRKETLMSEIQNLKSEAQEIATILINQETYRRKLHNIFQELKGNIRVFCRIRPPLPLTESVDTRHIIVNKFNDNSADQSMRIIKDSKASNFQDFTFDRIFDKTDTNKEIFEEIGQLVQSSLDGYNVCIFAYGQTGSGKTYTMLNPNDGMIPATLEHIFSWIESLKEKGWKYEISCQFVEIYNDNINDLLRTHNNGTTVKKPEIKHDEELKTTMITNVNTFKLTSKIIADDILEKANKRRSTASTEANERSSRSHSIFIIHLHGVNEYTGDESTGVLNLIDLAGSERIKTSKVIDARLSETQHINKSLSFLGDVIEELNSPDAANRHISFRNSKLTYLLQYSLTNDSKALMFVNISPSQNHIKETVSSLRFASKVNSTKIVKRKV